MADMTSHRVVSTSWWAGTTTPSTRKHTSENSSYVCEGDKNTCTNLLTKLWPFKRCFILGPLYFEVMDVYHNHSPLCCFDYLWSPSIWGAVSTLKDKIMKALQVLMPRWRRQSFKMKLLVQKSGGNDRPYKVRSPLLLMAHQTVQLCSSISYPCS